MSFPIPPACIANAAGNGRTYGEHHASLLDGLAEARLLLVPPDTLNVVPPVRVVRFMVRDVELAHLEVLDGKDECTCLAVE